MSRIQTMWRLALLGATAGFGLALRAGSSLATLTELEASQPATTAPRFVYGSGAQGFGYYVAPARPAAPATTPRSAAPSSVGPGARNWSTGRRSPLHRPWLRPM
jgi:hypothetical protein